MCIAVAFVIFMVLTVAGCATTNHSVYRSHLELIPIQEHGRISFRCNTDFDCKVVWKRDGS